MHPTRVLAIPLIRIPRCNSSLCLECLYICCQLCGCARLQSAWPARMKIWDAEGLQILAANKALAQKVRHPTSGLPPGPSQRQGPPTFVQTGHSKSASGHGPTDSYQAKHDSTTGRSTWGAKQALSLPPSTSSTTSTGTSTT